MQEPVLVRPYPILLYYGQFVMAAALGTLCAQFLLPDPLDSPRAEHWLWGLVLMWLFKPLITPIFKFVCADKLPPSCPVCAKRGSWWPRRAWMVAYGDRVDPDNWQIMYFCPSCRDCGWVYSGESRIYYIHPPEFFEKVKVYRKNFINGSWCWESSEEPSSPTPSGWKLYRSPRGIFRS